MDNLSDTLPVTPAEDEAFAELIVKLRAGEMEPAPEYTVFDITRSAQRMADMARRKAIAEGH
jgi:hypothetical protein